ncbi:hypothetical protein MMC30_009141 [Trapelia coarctata]|nr:hypothetical protein [Trapelia coarctata]
MLAWIVLICAYDTVFKVQYAWLSAAFLFSGGGTRVFNSLVFATVSDHLAHSRRAKYLYLLHAGPHVNRLITPRISAALMDKTLLTPFIVSFALLVTSLVVVLCLDERQGDNRSNVQYESVPSEEQTSVATTDETHLLSRPPEPGIPKLMSIARSRSSSRTSGNPFCEFTSRVARLFSTSAAHFCVVAFFLKRVAFTSEGFMFQYASEKFGWKLQHTTWLRVSAAIGAIFTTLIACPTLAYYFSTTGYKAAHVNIWIISVCLTILIIGFLDAFLAKSGAFPLVAMLFAGRGEGIEPALQGLITYLTDSSANTQLFTILALVDTVAEFTGGPLTTSLMAIGRSEEPKHASDGWCFFGSSLWNGVTNMADTYGWRYLGYVHVPRDLVG